MATVAVDFTHLDIECKAGDELADDHPLVVLAPHLFVQPPEPEPDPDAPPVRIRGPLVNPEPSSAAKPRSTTKKGG